MEKSIFTAEYAALRAELISIRKHAGLTQRDVAKRLMVPPSWIAKVESGQRRLDVVELYRLLSACGVEPMPALRRMMKAFSRIKHKRSGK